MRARMQREGKPPTWRGWTPSFEGMFMDAGTPPKRSIQPSTIQPSTKILLFLGFGSDPLLHTCIHVAAIARALRRGRDHSVATLFLTTRWPRSHDQRPMVRQIQRRGAALAWSPCSPSCSVSWRRCGSCRQQIQHHRHRVDRLRPRTTRRAADRRPMVTPRGGRGSQTRVGRST